MATLLHGLCVLCALTATGYSLSCTVCVSSSGTSCTGPSITCPADHVCMSSYTVTTARGIDIVDVFNRGCESQSKCGMSGSVSIADGKIKIGATCCTSDNCTPPIPTLPADNHQRNGVTCRTCTSADSDWCYTSDTMGCTGDEKMCLLQTTTMSEPISSNVAIRGCATESICNVGSQNVSSSGVNLRVTYKCSNRSVGLHPGFFLTVVALLLIKLLSLDNL
ncbi:hypothetical protein FKM82_013094 [Ascaphus truei]